MLSLINWAVLQYDESPIISHVSSSGPQFRYKTRVYKQTNLDEKALSKLSTKVNLITSIEHCRCTILIPAHWHPFFFRPLPFAGQYEEVPGLCSGWYSRQNGESPWERSWSKFSWPWQWRWVCAPTVEITLLKRYMTSFLKECFLIDMKFCKGEF